LSLLFPSMNYMFVIGYIGRYQEQSLPTNMLHAALATPNQSSPSRLNGIMLFVFLIVQIIAYPITALFVERWLHGTNSKKRTIGVGTEDQVSSTAIEIVGLTKIYPRTVWQKLFAHGKRSDVTAVNNLDLVAQKGQILCLLGANGSGKTTTLDMVGGLQKLTSGSIQVHAERSQLGKILSNVRDFTDNFRYLPTAKHFVG